jgi:hypothetical protein
MAIYSPTIDSQGKIKWKSPNDSSLRSRCIMADGKVKVKTASSYADPFVDGDGLLKYKTSSIDRIFTFSWFFYDNYRTIWKRVSETSSRFELEYAFEFNDNNSWWCRSVQNYNGCVPGQYPGDKICIGPRSPLWPSYLDWNQTTNEISGQAADIMNGYVEISNFGTQACQRIPDNVVLSITTDCMGKFLINTEFKITVSGSGPWIDWYDCTLYQDSNIASMAMYFGTMT